MLLARCELGRHLSRRLQQNRGQLCIKGTYLTHDHHLPTRKQLFTPSHRSSWIAEWTCAGVSMSQHIAAVRALKPPRAG